jgi:hypothetical protein
VLRRTWNSKLPLPQERQVPHCEARELCAALFAGTVREGVGELRSPSTAPVRSIARQLSLFEAEIRSILESQRPQRVHVLYFDSKAHKWRITKLDSLSISIPTEGGVNHALEIIKLFRMSNLTYDNVKNFWPSPTAQL